MSERAMDESMCMKLLWLCGRNRRWWKRVYRNEKRRHRRERLNDLRIDKLVRKDLERGFTPEEQRDFDALNKRVLEKMSKLFDDDDAAARAAQSGGSE